MIEIKKLTKEFATPRGKITVLKDFSLTVKEGIFLGVSGKSGAGKSTLLSLIAGLQKADSGEILIDGKNILALNDKDLCAFRNKNIGFISQEQSFLENLTVLDNVRLPVYLGGGKAGQAPSERALALLESLGIAHLANSFPRELSGGENHRVLIARALMNDPQLILADEATESVDSERTEQIVAIFKKLADQGKTVIFVSHDKSALKDCNQQIVIDY
ncbi:ABC-type antimicrobial peptide transport system, ATPase component [Treponema sp. JC4]|uniref:ABC transporter ATP-binding protein n=1 Tax=Treponema sp. JC4 TaxID=1124982 RepID=UPI00025B0DA5|nr:ABC transporter ATP-binding protein [Treponema sp. JC4]EID85800.1 ABC-type antimicrobial peptide transport system, ATPase component [Treponema sp. JC4]